MIENTTKKTIVSQKFSKKKGLGKLRGLIGNKPSQTLIFKTRFGIHTFFLSSPIDLIVIDKNKKVVFIKKKVKPNRLVFWNIKYDTVIEMPSGTLEKSKTRKGDILKF